MKLNFKALVASLIVCSTQFSTLPVYNNSILAMNPVKNLEGDKISCIRVTRAGERIYKFRGAIFSFNGDVIKIFKCPKGILTKKVLCNVLGYIRSCGITPESLVLGNSISSIAKGAFENPYVYYNDKEYAGNKIKKVIIHSGSTLDTKIRNDFRYYGMCGDLKGLEFRYFDKGIMASLPYDYEFDINIPILDNTTSHRGEYKLWSKLEKRELMQIGEHASTEQELYDLAVKHGIYGSSRGSVVQQARDLGWMAKK